jgi:hypothetical protein
VELMTHPIKPWEQEFLLSQEVSRLLPLGSTAA